MAKKAISGGRGVLGITYSGKTQARVPSATRSNEMPRADQTVQKGVRYTNQPMVDKGRVVKTMNPMRSRQQATSLVGGLGMQPYMNPKPSMQMRTGLTTTTAERTKMYGGTPSKAKTQVQTKAKAPARKPTEITVPGGGLRTGTKAKTKAPTRMAVNPRTGSTLGFTTGSRTGSTATKAGVAGKTRVSPAQQMARNAFNKGGVAGPSRSAGGSKSAGPSRSTGRSTSAPSRGDVGAGRRGGGR
jgi:hypothetical protein